IPSTNQTGPLRLSSINAINHICSGVNVSFEYAYLLSSCKHRRQPQTSYSSNHQKVTNKNP
ncbi:unnamed protein product, partial [Laminaria digitata]